jgi:selenocysteine lyase/cysteine desulfurase
MVILTSASNVTGKQVPVYEITKFLPENILVVCDGAQGGGHLPISMKKWRVDALALAGHKGLHGIQGSGALLLSERCTPKPLLYGGTGSTSYSLKMPDFLPDLLEVGTLSFPAILSLYEGIQFLMSEGNRANEKTYALTKYLCEKLHGNPEYKLYSTPNPCGIVAFANRNLQSEIVAHLLSDVYSIAVRGGLHCAPLTHKALGTSENGLVRVSFSHYNTFTEIDELLIALRKIAKANEDGLI